MKKVKSTCLLFNRFLCSIRNRSIGFQEKYNMFFSLPKQKLDYKYILFCFTWKIGIFLKYYQNVLLKCGWSDYILSKIKDKCNPTHSLAKVKLSYLYESLEMTFQNIKHEMFLPFFAFNWFNITENWLILFGA